MPKDEPTWKKVAGSQLLEAAREGFIGDVPEESGIYIWKLAVGPRTPFYQSSDLLEHVRSRLQTPVGLAKGHIGIVYNFENLIIAGRDLTADKIRTLSARASDAEQGVQFRGYMKQFLHTLDDFTPALYVGETGDLNQRVQDHLNGETTFSKSIADYEALHFGNLDFYFCTIPFQTEDKSIRTTLEYIVTITSLSGFGIRPG
jgi:hypothetical protein|tara:strand:- start:3535 stop:4140 length:606 start_codon:yes stop_codon:yes gene_type:complete